MSLSSSEPIFDSEMERATLGAILAEPQNLDAVLSETHLRPDDFHTEKHKLIWDKILELHGSGTPASTELVVSSSNGLGPYVAELATVAPKLEHVVHYARRVKEAAAWDQRRLAALHQLEAVTTRNSTEYLKAKSLTDRNLEDQSDFYTPGRLANEFEEFLKSDGIEAIPMPFGKLNDCLGGGLRRKQYTVLGGWTSHGKSVVIDQILSYASRSGFKSHLYMNEMSHEERVARILCRRTGINYLRIVSGDITDSERSTIRTELGNLPFSITPCAGWSLHELIWDIRSRKFDIIGIDILHQFDYDSEIELARISRNLTRVAKQANCHVIATVHLNEERAKDAVVPRPVKRDIRGSGMLQRDPDNIMFVYREQDPVSGDPQGPSSVYFSKVRSGRLGCYLSWFNEKHLRFDPSDGPALDVDGCDRAQEPLSGDPQLAAVS